MEIVMDYERLHDRVPENVSAEAPGFGIHLMGPESVRYVDAKARTRSGVVRVWANEWKKARHFGARLWPYFITCAATSAPERYRIQNPAARFRVGEDIFARGYMIHEDSSRE